MILDFSILDEGFTRAERNDFETSFSTFSRIPPDIKFPCDRSLARWEDLGLTFCYIRYIFLVK